MGGGGLYTLYCTFYSCFKTYFVHTQVDQPHLGLPSRDYYLQERSRKDLEAYHAYMTQVTPLSCFQVIYIYT
jgi:hypothetical protein